MSVGIRILECVIQARDKSILKELREELFTGVEESELYNYVCTHFGRFGEIPSKQLCHEAGYKVGEAKDDYRYYLEQVRSRHIYNSLTPIVREFSDQLNNKRLEDCEQTVHKMLNVYKQNKDSDLITSYGDVGVNKLLERYRNSRFRSGLSGVSFGYESLDDLTDGAQNGDLIVVAARPGVGKSFKLIRMAHNAWKNLNKRVMFVSMEMSEGAVSNRLAAFEIKVSHKLIMRGKLSQFKQRQLEALKGSYDGCHGFDILAGNLKKSIRDVEMAVAEYKPDILFVDSAYLLTPSAEQRNFNKFDNIAIVAEELKGLAIAANIPVVISTQFNRAATKKSKDNEPGLEWLYGSDVIGQVASVIIGILWGDAPEEKTTRKNMVLKNRDGEGGQYTTIFDTATMNMGEAEEGTTKESNNADTSKTVSYI